MAATIATIQEFYFSPTLSPERIVELRNSNHRTKSKYSANATASYIPSALFEETTTALKAKGNLDAPVEQLTAAKPITIELLIQLKDDFRNHAEGRITCFLLQCLLAYQSGLTFLDGKTRVQIGDWQLQDGVNPSTLDKSPYAAAHDSTLPSLWCQAAGSAQTHEFAQGSAFDALFNMTTLLPTLANNPIDTAIDLYTDKIGVNKSLRDAAIKILNRTSATKSTFTPLEAIALFIKKVLIRLKSIQRVYGDPKEQLVVKEYASVFKSYKKIIDNAFIYKFTFTKAETVNDYFYHHVRDMLYVRMNATKTMMSSITASVRKSPIKSSISLLTGESEILLEGVAAKYALKCSQSEVVQKLFLTYMEKTTLEDRQKDKTMIASLDNIRKKGSSEFPHNVRAIYQSCLELIGEMQAEKKEKKARKPSAAFYPQNMVDIVRSIMGLAKVKLGNTARQYSLKCSSDEKIQHEINEYMKLPEERRKADNEAILKLKKGKKTKENCLPIHLQPFYKLCLATIQRSKVEAAPKEPKKTTVKYMPQIIRRILQTLEKEDKLSDSKVRLRNEQLRLALR